MMGPVESALRNQLIARFQPTHLEVENESHQHSVPKNSETHFRVVIVADGFRGVNRVQRSRWVHEAVASLLTSAGGSVHALSLRVFDPDEWTKRGAKDDSVSPPCFGGSKRDEGSR